mgnify:CR=1 FL=1
MDTPAQSRVTPKDFFLWLGVVVTLYASVYSLIDLLFEYINHVFPDALRYASDPYSGAVSYDMASLLVLFPALIILLRFIRNDIAREPGKRDIWIRRWALVLTLFVAGATIVIDLITLVNTFLGGELTTRFLLKVLVVFLVAGAGFLHFLADLRGYWDANRQKSKLIGFASGILVFLAVASGFFIIGTPGEARLARFDAQKTNDLQTIQWQIVSYWQTKEKLPAELSELLDPISGFVIPHDPQTNVSYEYRQTGISSFELCADFNKENLAGLNIGKFASAPVPAGYYPSPEDGALWNHGVGRQCFERTIDPERYPPIKR